MNRASQQHGGVTALPAEVVGEHDQKATEAREEGRGVLLIPGLLQSHSPVIITFLRKCMDLCRFKPIAWFFSQF